MSKRKSADSPFSLFAFQDIITSICGIMILITLMLSLNISELDDKDASGSQVDPETYNETSADIEKKENTLNEIYKKIDDLNQQIDEMPNEVKALRQKDISSLENQINKTDKDIQDNEEKIESRQKEIEEIQALVDEQINLNEEKIKEAEYLKSKIAEEEDKLLDKETEINRSNNQIVYTTKDTTRTPYLIDISATRIKAKPVGNSALPSKSFSSEDEDSLVEMFLDWAEAQDPDECYYVLLVRPSALDAASEIRYQLLSKERFDVGIEMAEESLIVETK